MGTFINPRGWGFYFLYRYSGTFKVVEVQRSFLGAPGRVGPASSVCKVSLRREVSSYFNKIVVR